MKQDFLLHGTAADNTVRCMAVVTTNLVAEAMRRHQTAPTATAALGRALTGAILLGASVKELDRLTVQIRGDGPVGGITAEVNAAGNVRGYVNNPDADLPLNERGKLDVSGIVGAGMFYVMRESGFDLGLHREPYTGSVPLVSGEIAEDVAYYLAHSEQIPSAVLLGVKVRQESASAANKVIAAGGVMLQMMPGVEDTVISEIENAVSKLPHTTDLILNGASPHDLIKAALGSLPFEAQGEKTVRFACACSRERAESIMSSIHPDEVESMLREDGEARFICHFCNEHYLLGRETLERLLAHNAQS